MLNDFPSFLNDHAACERKASATGLNFVVQYPDRTELIEPMIQIAREELLHFQQVYTLLKKQGLQLSSDERTPYVNKLLSLIRTGRDQRFLDRLLTFGIIEARGAERFGIVAENISDPELKVFYQKLTQSEKQHHEFFLKMALKYFSTDEVELRLDELLTAEAEIMKELPLRAAVQ
ncbi:MAG: tRNA hydroxylase [Bacteriovoracaceae bacterium]|nr:tRNA hydroxylase [Bacteriovoracaceae bacterium]